MTPPRLTVIVASFRSPELLAACLDSIDRARGEDPVKVVVARSGSTAEVEHLIVDRPWVEVLSAPADATVPSLRGAGMVGAGGGWMAVTEDHCVVDRGWIEALRSVIDGAHQLVGGAVGNARAGVVDWAAYFSEYGFFGSGRDEAEGCELITGANVLYGPEVAERAAAWATEGLWEDVIHARLEAEGVRGRFLPGAKVRQNASYTVKGFIIDRFEHGLSYARDRLAEDEASTRLGRLLTTPLLPLILLLRVARRGARGQWAAFVRALPWTGVFLAAWAAGEAVGYLKGPRA